MYRNAFDGTGIMLNKANWHDGILVIDSCLIAADKTIKARFIVPDEIRLIAAGAFQGNKTLTTIAFPESITCLDHETFKDCKNLVKVGIPSTITSIGEDVFTNTGIWNNEKRWKKGALYVDGCLIAVNDNLPAKFVFKNKFPTRLIVAGAFSGSKTLTHVVIPEGITFIPATAFHKCEKLVSVSIPSTVKSVGNFAFYGCSLLKSATLPKNLESLGMGAFTAAGI